MSPREMMGRGQVQLMNDDGIGRRRLDPGSFEIHYRFSSNGTAVAQGLTHHLAISTGQRERRELLAAINRWLEASALKGGVQPL